MRKIIEGAPAEVGHHPKVFVGSLLATVSHLVAGVAGECPSVDTWQRGKSSVGNAPGGLP